LQASYTKSVRKSCILGIETAVGAEYLSCMVNYTLAIEITVQTLEIARADHGTYQSGCFWNLISM
jgi:hypothetical protein